MQGRQGYVDEYRDQIVLEDWIDGGWKARGYHSEAEAKAKCPTDTVVWVNTKSHKYHYAGHRSYGTTKQGAYMCEADATAGGNAAAKGEKPKE